MWRRKKKSRVTKLFLRLGSGFVCSDSAQHAFVVFMVCACISQGFFIHSQTYLKREASKRRHHATAEKLRRIAEKRRVVWRFVIFFFFMMDDGIIGATSVWRHLLQSRSLPYRTTSCAEPVFENLKLLNASCKMAPKRHSRERGESKSNELHQLFCGASGATLRTAKASKHPSRLNKINPTLLASPHTIHSPRRLPRHAWETAQLAGVIADWNPVVRAQCTVREPPPAIAKQGQRLSGGATGGRHHVGVVGTARAPYKFQNRS